MARPGGLLGISTSGNSPNVVQALQTARDMKMKTLALTGEGGGKLATVADILIEVPSRSTPGSRNCTCRFITTCVSK